MIDQNNLDADIDVINWIRKNGISTEDGRPLQFDDFPFLHAIYNDLSPRMVITKSAQIGASVMSIIKAFYLTRHLGVNVLYALPTYTDVGAFVASKVNRLVAQSSYLQKLIQDDDTISQKIINVSDKIRPLLFFLGASTPPKMLSADVLFFDELDSADAEFADQFTTRLQGSKLQWEHYFSHPSSPGAGVDKYYQLSDKHEWHVTCSGCKNEFYLEWDKHAKKDTKQYHCDRCNEVITDEVRRAGKWKPTVFGEDLWRGYHISMMISPMYSCKRLWQYQEEKSTFYFNTRILGIPDRSGDRSIETETILQNCTPQIFQDNPSQVIIAVDPNKVLRLVIGNSKGLFHFEESEDFTIVDKYMEMYPSAIMIVDSGGEISSTRQWQERYQDRCQTVYYGTDKTGETFARWNEDNNTVTIEVNRCITETANNFKLKRIALQGSRSDWKSYTEHWTSLYAVMEENKQTGVMRKVWKTTSRKDLALCTTYYLLAIQRFRNDGGPVVSYIRL
jgi:hypothetical protein